jgi:hypothetical protein
MDATSGRVCPARGFHALSGGSASLEGSTRPSSKVCLARGLSTPSGGVRPTRGLPCTHPPRISRAVTRTCSRMRVRAFNALTQQGRATTLTRLGIMPWRCFANSRGRSSPLLFSTVRRGQCQLHDTVSPAPVRLTCRALEGGAVAPSNIFYMLMQDHTVMSGRRDRSSPSFSGLCGHPRHCSTTRGAVATSRCCFDVRGQDIATIATVPRTGFPSTAPSNWPTMAAGQPTTAPQPRSRSCTSAGHTTTPQRERNSPGRPSAPQHCSPYRYTYRNSAAHMLTAPSLAYKRRGSPPATGERHGTTDGSHSHALRLPHDIGTHLNQISGTWRPCLLSLLACSHPSTSTTVQAIQCPEHTAAGRTAPAGTRINQVSLVA